MRFQTGRLPDASDRVLADADGRRHGADAPVRGAGGSLPGGLADDLGGDRVGEGGFAAGAGRVLGGRVAAAGPLHEGFAFLVVKGDPRSRSHASCPPDEGLDARTGNKFR